MAKHDYTVTGRAGTFVAGRRVKSGQVLQLTENEARAEVLAGTLVKGASAAAPADRPARGRKTRTGAASEPASKAN